MECATTSDGVNLPTDSCQIGSPAGSKTPDTPSRCRSPGSPIGDDACPICLGAFTDKCAAGSCLHNFCLVCLKEWAKQRPVCPLCKQPFTKILYDIKSETDYKEWNIPVPCPHEIGSIGNYQIIRERIYQTFGEYLDQTNRRFFRYRSTRTSASRNLENEILNDVMDTYPRIPSLPPRREHRPVPERGSSSFRLSIYTNNVWIQPMADVTGRYRESNPNLYREQPALTHRLVPWVNRELAALLPPSRIGVVLSDIMELIERYPINGRPFRRALRPHLGRRTRHFVHEFYNFARSPYDMIGHDQAAQYIPGVYMTENETDDDTDGSDDDDIVEIDSDGAAVESEPLDLSSRVAREETIGNDGSIFISSDSDSSVQNSSNSNVREVLLLRNPSPSLPIRSPSIDSPREERNAIRSLDEPGPSGVFRSGIMNVKSEATENVESADSDDCLIVDVLKPKKERTPELIDISSGSESGSANQTHWKKKISKQLEDKNSKSRKKPRIDRTSFSLQFSGTLNCQRGEDHNYCTESTSSLNPGSNRTESDDDNFRICRSLYNTKKRWDLLMSGSDSDTDTRSNSTDEFKPGKRKPKYYKSSTKRVCNGNSRNESLSPSTRKGKKDHKSKIKSSSKLKSSTSEEKSSITDSLRKVNSKYISKKSGNGYGKKLRARRKRSSSTSSFDSSFSSTSRSSLSSSSSSSYSSSSSSSSSSSLNSSISSFTCSSESDESYYSSVSLHRKRVNRRPSKEMDNKKRRHSIGKSKGSKSSKEKEEKGKGTCKKRSSKSKKSQVEKKSSKKSAKEVGKHRHK
ncbi:UNVERIFIED_CONTAM: hypothetical protein RMT77_001988 [Armadillidium vulgare]